MTIVAKQRVETSLSRAAFHFDAQSDLMDVIKKQAARNMRSVSAEVAYQTRAAYIAAGIIQPVKATAGKGRARK